MVLIVVTTASRTPILRRPHRDPNIPIQHATFKAPTPSGATDWQTPNPAAQHGAHALGVALAEILVGLVLLGLLWLLVAIAVSVIRRWQHRRRVAQQGALAEVDDAVLDAVTEAAGRQQQRILEGAPSNAVVACWVDLEQAVAQVGVERRPSETSAELTIRVLDALDVDRRALRTLGALYREARYSKHPLTEDDRASAQQALATLHRTLLATTGERV